MRVVLRLDDGERVVAPPIKDVIRALRLIAKRFRTFQNDATVGDLRFHRNFVGGPTTFKRRSDVQTLNILFRQFFFRQYSAHLSRAPFRFLWRRRRRTFLAQTGNALLGPIIPELFSTSNFPRAAFYLDRRETARRRNFDFATISGV